MLIYIKLLLTSLFWAGTFIAGRILGQNENVNAVSAAFLRFFLASILFIAIIRKKKEHLPHLKVKQLFTVILLGLTGVFSYHILFLKGLQTIEASRASIIIATCPVFIALCSVFFFKEKLTKLKLAGIILSVTGAIIVISKGKLKEIFNQNLGIGELCIFGCVISWVLYSLIGKVMTDQFKPLMIVSYSVIIGMFFLLIPAFPDGIGEELATYTKIEWLSLIYLAVFGTVISYVWFYDGLSTIGATRSAIFINFIPIFSVVLAFIILKEPITVSLLTGAALVICGVCLTNIISSRNTES